MSRRKKRARHPASNRRSVRSLTALVMRTLVVETIESLLELTNPYGSEICANFRESDPTSSKYVRMMLAEFFDRHSVTIDGAWALGLFSQVACTQLNVFLIMISRYFPSLTEASPIGIMVAAIGCFLWGYISSVLTNIAVPERDTKATTVFVVVISLIALVHSPGYITQAVFWQLYPPLILGMFAGAPTVRTFKRLTRH